MLTFYTIYFITQRYWILENWKNEKAIQLKNHFKHIQHVSKLRVEFLWKSNHNIIKLSYYFLCILTKFTLWQQPTKFDLLLLETETLRYFQKDFGTLYLNLGSITSSCFEISENKSAKNACLRHFWGYVTWERNIFPKKQ